MNKTVGKLGANADIGLNVTDSLRYSAWEEADVYVTRPERKPLRGDDDHAKLRIAPGDDDMYIDVYLDAEGLDALADAIYHTQDPVWAFT